MVHRWSVLDNHSLPFINSSMLYFAVWDCESVGFQVETAVCSLCCWDT